MPLLPRLEFTFFDDPPDLADAFRNNEVDAVSGLSPAAAADFATLDGARALRYPGTTLTTVILNLRPAHVELRDPAVRAALQAAIDQTTVITEAFGGLAGRADSPIPPTSWAFDAATSPPIAYDPAAAADALTKAGWTKVEERLRPPGATEAYTVELVVPDAATNPTLHAVAEQVATSWESIGLTVELVEAEAGAFLSEYLREGNYTAAVIDVAIGHDPDLYPLLASSQTQTGGLNVMGLQDATLDGLLAAARKPGTEEVRKAAYTALQTQLAAGRYVLPIAFADEVVVVREDLEGPVVQPVADPSNRFWDVLTWRLANDR
jgi:ABC-type transport system substrate-binding protein